MFKLLTWEVFTTTLFLSGQPSLREAQHRQRYHQLCLVQVWPFAPEGLANHVRLGQDVPALSQPLETGAARRQEKRHVARRDLSLQSQLHSVALLLPCSGFLRLATALRHHHHLRKDSSQIRVPGNAYFIS